MLYLTTYSQMSVMASEMTDHLIVFNNLRHDNSTLKARCWGIPIRNGETDVFSAMFTT